MNSVVSCRRQICHSICFFKSSQILAIRLIRYSRASFPFMPYVLCHEKLRGLLIMEMKREEIVIHSGSSRECLSREEIHAWPVESGSVDIIGERSHRGVRQRREVIVKATCCCCCCCCVLVDEDVQVRLVSGIGQRWCGVRRRDVVVVGRAAGIRVAARFSVRDERQTRLLVDLLHSLLRRQHLILCARRERTRVAVRRGLVASAATGGCGRSEGKGLWRQRGVVRRVEHRPVVDGAGATEAHVLKDL